MSHKDKSRNRSQEFFVEGFYPADDYSASKHTGHLPAVRCHITHKPLVVTSTGGVISGGSCIDPPSGFDIYIGFDSSMKRTPIAFPWQVQQAPTSVEVYMPIQDMRTPKNELDFKNLVRWTLQQIDAGKKIHAGCIGGHGRTGLFFTALVAQGLGDTNALEYVRNNYCQKAVESREQVNFLVNIYGIKPAKGHKENSPETSFKQIDRPYAEWSKDVHPRNSKGERVTTSGKPFSMFNTKYDPLKVKPNPESKLAIWNKPIDPSKSS